MTWNSLRAYCRRSLLPLLAGLLLCLFACGGGSSNSGAGATATATPSPTVFFPGDTPVPATGPAVPGVEAYDREMSALLKRWNVPGAAVAVARRGKLILARGYGYADFEAQQLMQPDSMSRIGSNSKVLTAIALLQLKEQGRLDLDAKFLDILTEYQVQPGGDARLRDITIRHLMHHAGGWDRRLSGDAITLQTTIATALNVPTPVMCPDIIRYMMGRPLDFPPGTRAAYSNFGFCILGRVVEKVSGEPYELYVRNHVLAPMGIQDMSIGYSHLSERGPKEVKYYETYQMPSVYPGEGSVQAAYGSVDMVSNDSCGGWIASAIDLTRFLTALDGSRTTAPLAAATMAEFTANPGIPGLDSATSWYGLGIYSGPTPQTWWHGGSIPGSTSQMVRDVSGYTWAGFVNSQTSDPGGIFNDLNQAMIRALGTGFPGSSTDLYSQYPSPDLPARYR